MITVDPARRAALLADIQQRLSQDAAPEDRDRLLAFAAVVCPEMPDAMALQLEPGALATRIAGYFRFVAKSIPPEHQLYRGLPGIHVSVRNPDEAEEAATGSASGHYHEVTIVETHTPDAPFIFESLKNFFQNEGLRVFSSIHPIFTVRRQWERIAWIGGSTEDGSRELYCQFRIERIEAREKLRRVEHQIYSLLKSVFLAVEDYAEMIRATARPGRARAGPPGHGGRGRRAGVPALAGRRQLRAPGPAAVQPRDPTDNCTPPRTRRWAPSRTRRCFPWSSLASTSASSAHIEPAEDDDRDRRHRLLHQRLGDPPSGADRRHRRARVGA